LKLFEKLRLGRTIPVQIFSNMPMGPDGYSWMLEKMKPYWDKSKALPPPGTKPHEPYFCHYLYCYDSFEVAKQAIADAEVEKYGVAHTIPNGHTNGVKEISNGVSGQSNGIKDLRNSTDGSNGINGTNGINVINGVNGANGEKVINGHINGYTNGDAKLIQNGGPVQPLHTTPIDQKPMKDSNELVELAQTCMKSAVLVNNYFESNPGTNPLTCARFPSMDDRANAARLKLRNAAKELYELTTGPQEMLMEQCIFSVSQSSPSKSTWYKKIRLVKYQSSQFSYTNESITTHSSNIHLGYEK
jgi:hypothetical protein